jgi:hypothetical protein
VATVLYAVKRGDDGRYADGNRGWDQERAGAFDFHHVKGVARDVRGHQMCGAADHAETFEGDVNEAGEPLDVHVVRITDDGESVVEERVATLTTPAAQGSE